MSLKSRPRVSVIMTVHNGERYLHEAVESILGQSFSDFEFLIVDDASDDATPEVLANLAALDSRIRVLTNDINIGPFPSANRALEIARAPIIARMDADDISMPERLARQVAFLDAHPDHILVGCGYLSIDSSGRKRFSKPNPLDDFAVRWVAQFRMPMVHPGICFRGNSPDGCPVRYREDNTVAQDYAMVADVLGRGKSASLPEMLVKYRMHPANISSVRRGEQNLAALGIALRVMEAEQGECLRSAFLPLLETLYRKRGRATEDLVATKSAFQVLIAKCAANADARWMKRRAAGILAEAYVFHGKLPTRAQWLFCLMFLAPEFIPALFMRMLELKGVVRANPAPGQRCQNQRPQTQPNA